MQLNNRCKGEPIKLKSHTAVVYKDAIYLFGGEISPINSNNLTYRFDIASSKWEKIEPNIDLPKVDSHSAVIVDDQMLVYGGYIPEKAQYMSDMYAFDLEKHTWQLYHRKG